MDYGDYGDYGDSVIMVTVHSIDYDYGDSAINFRSLITDYRLPWNYRDNLLFTTLFGRFLAPAGRGLGPRFGG